MSTWLRSVVRTVVPGAWAAFVLWLVSLGLPAAATDWLASESVATKVVELASLATVYGFVRWVEPHLPDWVTRLLLGSAKAPTYDYDSMSPSATVSTQLGTLDMVASIGRSAQEHANLIRAREIRARE